MILKINDTLLKIKKINNAIIFLEVLLIELASINQQLQYDVEVVTDVTIESNEVPAEAAIKSNDRSLSFDNPIESFIEKESKKDRQIIEKVAIVDGEQPIINEPILFPEVEQVTIHEVKQDVSHVSEQVMEDVTEQVIAHEVKQIVNHTVDEFVVSEEIIVKQDIRQVYTSDDDKTIEILKNAKAQAKLSGSEQLLEIKKLLNNENRFGLSKFFEISKCVAGSEKGLILAYPDALFDTFNSQISEILSYLHKFSKSNAFVIKTDSE